MIMLSIAIVYVLCMNDIVINTGIIKIVFDITASIEGEMRVIKYSKFNQIVYANARFLRYPYLK